MGLWLANSWNIVPIEPNACARLVNVGPVSRADVEGVPIHAVA